MVSFGAIRFSFGAIKFNFCATKVSFLAKKARLLALYFIPGSVKLAPVREKKSLLRVYRPLMAFAIGRQDTARLPQWLSETGGSCAIIIAIT